MKRRKTIVLTAVAALLVTATLILAICFKTVPTVGVQQDALLQTFLSDNFPVDRVIDQAFAVKSGDSHLYVLVQDTGDTLTLENFGTCCDYNGDTDLPDTFNFYQGVFADLKEITLAQIKGSGYITAPCTYTEGLGFLETTYDTHYDIYGFSVTVDDDAYVLLCATLLYPIEIT